MKEKAQHRGREGRAWVWDLEKFYYYFFFNIMLMWKFVGVSKVSVLYFGERKGTASGKRRQSTGLGLRKVLLLLFF